MDAMVRAERFAALRGRRVLVTGSTGFKGGWLCAWLLELGAKVSGFALPPEPEAPLFGQLRLGERIDQHFGDIRDAATVSGVFDAVRPEVCIHLAAQALVRRSYAEPKRTFDTNIGGGVNLLEAVRTAPDLRALVFATSDKCYRNKEWVWGYRENDELGGPDPYSGSKAAAELVFGAYQESFLTQREKLGAATVRAGNVIGGGDWSADRIVPDAIRSLVAGRRSGCATPLRRARGSTSWNRWPAISRPPWRSSRHRIGSPARGTSDRTWSTCARCGRWRNTPCAPGATAAWKLIARPMRLMRRSFSTWITPKPAFFWAGARCGGSRTR